MTEHETPRGRTSAAVVVTGTEVLTGRVPDANGPWLAERLLALGVEIGTVTVVGDRRADLVDAVQHLVACHDLVITTGGLGPTADDLTAEVVGEVQGRPLHHDAALEQQIAEIVDGLMAARGWERDTEEVRAGTRKQAMVPAGASVLAPVGTAPGLVVPPASGDRAPVLVLPGPPRELQGMWDDAVADDRVRRVLADASDLEQRTVRIWGPPEAQLAGLLRDHEATVGSARFARLEITTCLRDGELEVVTRFSPEDLDVHEELVRALLARFGDQVFSPAGDPVDRIVADALTSAGATVATAESCTAGLLAGRLADVPGSSAYLLGGFVTYANQAKTVELDVPTEAIEQHGAVSREVAEAMALGARARLGTTYGISTTGVAGPGGGTPDKPVGRVHVALAGPDGVRQRQLDLPGDRAFVRGRTVTVCLHLLREELADRRRPG
ncbi:competence/damage-inducible protein A [Nocardioidaceae bacterium]|nr:competence/damage-inducible protein A [Nocardioidaceae bacterium]